MIHAWLACSLLLAAPSPKPDTANKRLVDAVETDDYTAAKSALRAGANPNAIDSDSEPVIFAPARPPYVGGGDLKMVELLLSHGAKVTARGYERKTVLMEACESGWPDIAHYLIRKGALVNAVDKNGRTALMYAANWGQTEDVATLSSPDIVRLLLKHGANVHAVDKQGESALILAAMADIESEADASDATKTVALLISHGANVNHRDKHHRSALSWAKAMHHRAMQRLLRRAGARF